MKKITTEPFKLIGISIRTTNENNLAATDITDLWNRFIKENVLEAIPNKIDDTIYSVYTNYVSDHTEPYTAVLGCKVKNLSTIPEGMIGKSIEGGKYLKLTAKGNLMMGLIVNKWQEIWNLDLDRAFTTDFEIFGEKALDPTDAEIDFFIAVK
ncbi:GyrI-like domain-containing protein [Sphingobacterium sp. JUb56]|uniref:GyrI-like domain-containing protein n=1 Tax=Sphingobacterium sp. JUb56 TaxID=2587145 RepID=UPI00160DD19A|nr:effector binding domain-containing protein [Sphingobacterium sp. JUb56]MBB2950736.1 putative transcriptional regulator YdeE [Sphingobacterium sp. JUb56]